METEAGAELTPRCPACEPWEGGQADCAQIGPPLPSSAGDLGGASPRPCFSPIPVLLLLHAVAESFDPKSVASIAAALQHAGFQPRWRGEGGRDPAEGHRMRQGPPLGLCGCSLPKPCSSVPWSTVLVPLQVSLLWPGPGQEAGDGVFCVQPCPCQPAPLQRGLGWMVA